MPIQDLVVKLGAPNEDALLAAMDSFGLSVDDLATSSDNQQFFKDYFAKASAMTTTQESAPVKQKRGRKALKNITEDKANSANEIGNAKMALVTEKIQATQRAEFKQLAKDLTEGADNQSDAIAALMLAYPGFTAQMAAEKINQGLNNQTPGFRLDIHRSNPDDALQEALEELGIDFEIAYEAA